MKRIATLLTVFNRKDKTLQSLHNLYAQLPLDGYELDVFLTNDGCTDGTPEAVAAQFPLVNIINGSGDLFWNRGMYTAWEEAAKGDYDLYLWLNDDTFLYDDALATIVADAAMTNYESIICGATCSAVDGTMTYGGRDANGLIMPNGELQRCRHFNGNIVLIPRSVYQILGNLDYKYRHAYGDFDYGMRASKVGIKALQSSKVVGTCELHDSLPKWCNPEVKLSDRIKAFRSPLGGSPKGQLYFDRKHYGLLRGLFHYFTIHLRVVMPQIWNFKNR